MRILSFLPLASTIGVVIAYEDYDTVNHLEFNSTSEFISALFNNAGKASTNILVAYTTPECKSKIDDHPSIKGSQRHAGSYSFTSATVVDTAFPIELTDCIELAFYRYDSESFTPDERTPLLEPLEIVSWVRDQMSVQGFTMTNDFDFPVQLFWCDENKDPTNQGILQVLK